MRKQIRAQMIKMLVLVGALAGLVTFSWDFVQHGLMAKVYLNGFIFCVFSFGVLMAFRNIMSLRNEELAFSALAETYDDIKRSAATADDPYWRHYRCLDAGMVFQRPRLLGHFFEIVYEELLRTKNLRISVVTMQNLVQGVENKLAEERSLVSYISGLLVFLGLIGAFIGLMQMVQSVGGIVGGLAVANPGENVDGFSRLISQLQGPLGGMATGFSSSLFGLCGSLTLGLLGRLANQAGTVLKTEFASWLANVVQIEASTTSATGETGFKGVITQSAATKQLADAAATMSHSLTQTQASYDNMTTMLERSTRAQVEQAASLTKVSVQMAHLVTLQEEIKGNLLRSNSHGASMVSAKDELLRLGRAIETHLTEGFMQLSGTMETYQRTQTESVQQLMTLQEQLVQTAAASPKQGQGAPVSIDATQIEAAVQNAVARSLAQLPTVASDGTELTKEQAARIEETRMRLQALGKDGSIEDLRAQVQHLEEGMAAGFNGITRAVETIFATYAEKLPRGPQRTALQQADEAMPVGEVKDVEPADHEEMIRRLYSKVAEHYQPTGSDE